MQVTVENITNLERKLTISIPADEIESEVQKHLDDLASKVKIDGFRPGKAPFSIVKERYFFSVLNEALGEVINRSYSSAIKQEKLEPVGEPQIKSLPYEPNEPFVYTAIVEIYPDVTLDISDIQVEKPIVEVTQEDVDAALERIRAQKAISREVSRAAKAADLLLLDYVGIIDGKPFPNGECHDARVVLGNGSLLPDFEKSIYGAKAGDTVKAKFIYEKNYMDLDLAGKEVEFTIQVKKIYELELPPLNDAFAKGIGIESGDLAGLRSETEETIQHHLKPILKQQFYARIIQKLAEKNPVESPKILVDREIDRLKKQYPNGSFSFDEIARHNINAGILVEGLINMFDIKIDQKKFDERLKDLPFLSENPKKAANLQNNSQRLNQLVFSLLEEQAMEELVTKINVIEKKISHEEFLRGSY